MHSILQLNQNGILLQLLLCIPKDVYRNQKPCSIQFVWERFGVDSPVHLSVFPVECICACAFSLGQSSGLMDVNEKLVESALQVLVSVVGLV